VTERNPAAFEKLVERHRDMVYSVCKRILNNAADAEDAAQDCFLELPRQARDVGAPIGGWLHCVAVRISMRMRQQRSARRAREAEIMSRRANGTEPSWTDVSEYVDEAVAVLPVKLREAVILHYLEWMNQAEVALELGVTRSAISKQLAKGIDFIRRRLNRRGVAVTSVLLGSLLTANAVKAAQVSLAAAIGNAAIAGLSSSRPLAG